MHRLICLLSLLLLAGCASRPKRIFDEQRASTAAARLRALREAEHPHVQSPWEVIRLRRSDCDEGGVMHDARFEFLRIPRQP